MPYSENDRFQSLAQNLGFDFFIFDDPDGLGKQIKLRDKNKNGEIDAILLYKNVVCIIGLNKSGNPDSVTKDIRHFFEKLDKTNRIDDFSCVLEGASIPTKVIPGVSIARKYLEKINKQIKKYRNNYHVKLTKIYLCSNVEIEGDFISSEREKGNIIIDKDIYEYFEEIAICLGRDFLFKDFIHFLNIKKSDLKKKSASGRNIAGLNTDVEVTRLSLEKSKIIMYSGVTRVEDISDYISVLRLAQKYNKKGFQRMVKSSRLDKINKNYLKKNETFPNNIIIALDPEIYKNESSFYSSSHLKLIDEYNSLILIDGQHRFFSFIRGKKNERFILVTFIFFEDCSEATQFMQIDRIFYEINKKQEKIDPNLAFELLAKIEPDSEENFWYSVFKLLNRKGFFAKRFSFKETALRRVDRKKSIVSVIRYGGVLKLKETRNKGGVNSEGLEVYYNGSRQKNILFAYRLLRNYFDVVEEGLKAKNIAKDQLSPREIGALLRLLRHFVLSKKSEVKIFGEIEAVTKSTEIQARACVDRIRRIISYLPFEKIIQLDLSSSNWAAVEGYMLKKINKRDPNFGNKRLLSRKGMDIYRKS